MATHKDSTLFSLFSRKYDIISSREPIDISDLSGLTVLGSQKDISGQSRPQSYSHLMRRAWEEMELNGIVCKDNIPVIYIKYVDEFDPIKIRILHRQIWNQGIATILAVITPDEIYIYSGMALPARSSEAVSGGDRLIAILRITSDLFEVMDLLRQIVSGKIYQNNQRSFSPRSTIDHHLLNNLKATRIQLFQCGGMEQKEIHSLLGRIIFTSYLTARGIITEENFSKAGASGINDLLGLFSISSCSKIRSILRSLFIQLHEKFDGSLFDEEVYLGRNSLTDKHIDIIRRFLKGDIMESGQMTFGFWIYDFRIIPIETISAIYEDFLSAEDLPKKQASGAFYTPKHLAETMVDVAIENYDSLLDKTFMDPACGSGIFLVILFNRIAEEWRRKNENAPNIFRARALQKVLQSQLYGIDINETACRITCFSLYLAFLDQLDPRDINELETECPPVLPRLLSAGDQNDSSNTGGHICNNDFFAPSIFLGEEFDLIIGNPPWIGREDPRSSRAQSWFEDPAPRFKHIAESADNLDTIFMPQGQIAHTFMWKAPLHLKPDGRVCLLLPSKVFLNNSTQEFQKYWFSEFAAEKIIQLADLRYILFDNARTPAMIVRFTNLGELNDFCINYEAPKFTGNDPRRGVLTIFQEDTRRIHQSDILSILGSQKEIQVFWKRLQWATPRDMRLLDRLYSMPNLREITGHINNPKRWIIGDGFQPWHEDIAATKPGSYPKGQKAWWDSQHLYLDARKFNAKLVINESDCQAIGRRFNKLRRCPQREMFRPPMVVMNHAFSKKVFCDFPLLFQHTLSSISGPASDTELLAFLAVVLESKLASYFLFHTSASWGIERDRLSLVEILRMPFPLPEATAYPDNSRKIVKYIYKKILQLKKSIQANMIAQDPNEEGIYQAIIPLIHEYYDLSESEIALLEETADIIIPSITPQSINSLPPTIQAPDVHIRKRYTEYLCETLNYWNESDKYKISGSAIIQNSIGLGIVALSKSQQSESYKEINGNRAFDEYLGKIGRYLRIGGLHYAILKGLKIFDGNHLYLLKPLNARHWTKIAALNDADEIAKAILLNAEDGQCLV